MSLAVTAVIGATVSAASLGFSIYSSQQQLKASNQAKTDAGFQAAGAQEALANQQKIKNSTDAQTLALSNERRRVGSAPAVASGPPSVGGGPATPASPATVTRGTGSLLGS